MRYRQDYTVTAQDMDPDYLMTPSAILLYSQDALAAYFSRHRIAAFDVIKKGLIWVFTDYEIEAGSARPYWQDTISVEVWLSGLSTLKAYLDFRITAPDGSEAAHGSTCWSALDSRTRRPSSVKDLILASGMEVEGDGCRHPRTAFPQAGERTADYTHLTNALDMDFNGHVTNRTYLHVALAGMSVQMLRACRLRSVRMKFIRETFVGDTIRCEWFRTEAPLDSGAPSFLTRLTDQEGHEVCRIALEWASASPQEPIDGHIERQAQKPKED